MAKVDLPPSVQIWVGGTEAGGKLELELFQNNSHGLKSEFLTDTSLSICVVYTEEGNRARNA